MRRARVPLPVVGAALALAAAAGLAVVSAGSSVGGEGSVVAEERAPDVPAGDEDAGEGLVEGLLGSSAEESVESERSLAEEAGRVLEEGRARGDCVVAEAGYLDLAGRAWGCVLQGSGWAEVCLVREAEDGGGCVVSVWRMDAGSLERALGAGS